jgi:chorismate mutase
MSRELIELRKKIDGLDRRLVKVLAERFFLTEKVGIYKKKNKLKPYDKKRETEMMDARKEWAEKYRLDPAAAKKIFQFIIRIVREKHREK